MFHFFVASALTNGHLMHFSYYIVENISYKKWCKQICYVLKVQKQAFHSVSLAAVVSQFEFGRDLGWEENMDVPTRELCFSSILCIGGCQGRRHCVELELVWESGISNFCRALFKHKFIYLSICLSSTSASSFMFSDF